MRVNRSILKQLTGQRDPGEAVLARFKGVKWSGEVPVAVKGRLLPLSPPRKVAAPLPGPEPVLVGFEAYLVSDGDGGHVPYLVGDNQEYSVTQP